MCGIMGYVGKTNAIPIVINGLKNLEYRGYDSSGIAYLYNNQIKVIKEKGRISELEKLLTNDESSLCIGHTRWATHGSPNKINAHPHKVGSITIVHNGIIENYNELKIKLIKDGYKFKSETDTEVVCALIDKIYKKNKDKLKTLDEIKNILKGSYAFLIIFEDDKTIYALRHGSPLIIASSEIGNVVASDIPAILDYSKEYYLLLEGEIAEIKEDKIIFYQEKKEIKKEKLIFNHDLSSAKKDGYKHFMLKEIYEQPKVIKDYLEYYFENFQLIPSVSKYKSIHIVACGSAYHAGLLGKSFLEQYLDFPIIASTASEYRYSKNFINNNTLVILISQSGETADTLAALRLAKEKGAKTIGIVNVVGSSLARECDEVVYINAGCEIAVATTKAYTLQVLTLSLMAFKLGIEKKLIDDDNIEKLRKEYLSLPKEIDKLLKKDYQKIAKKIYKSKSIFFIGRLMDYYSCLEGSLKLKEISYIHSETYPAGELKHGTISLIEEKTPVISLATLDNIYEKTISNIKETKARGAFVILLKRNDFKVDKTCYDEEINIPKKDNLILPILTTIPLQILAYEVANILGYDIDKPRNLAKSVTVE